MRVHRIAHHLQIESEIIPYNWSTEQKHERLQSVEANDYVLIQKWRNEFNNIEHIKRVRGIKIFDMDDITGDKEALDLADHSDILFMANHFLVNWAKTTFPTKRVHLVPTGIEIPEDLPIYEKRDKPVVLIAKYGVDRYIPHIAKLVDWAELHRKHGLELLILGTTTENDNIIGDFCKMLPLVPLNEFWPKYGSLLSTATVGIMPLRKKAQGKSGFSVLTMMSAGLPVIASPYGECDHIITDGIDGFLADSKGEWTEKLEFLLTSHSLRQKMSIEALKTIIKKYTTKRIAEEIQSIL